MGEELLGIEELELALQSYEPVLNIKESEFSNVILVDLGIDPSDAISILKDTPTTVISKAVPIDSVVRTTMDGIIERVLKIAGKKVNSGDSFAVRCDLRGRKYIKSKDKIITTISDKLIDDFNLKKDEKNPKWVVQIEVVGDDTGINVLKPDEFLKKGFS